MAKMSEAWGLDIGANAIKAMKLARDDDGVTVIAHEVVEFKRVLTTPDLDVDEEIQLGLEKLLAKHDLTDAPVFVSVAGNMAIAKFAKLPPVNKKQIRGMVQYEAKQQIPFPLEEVEWDYQVFSQDDMPDIEVGIFAITRARVEGFLRNLQDVGIRVEGVTLSPLSVYNAFTYDQKLDADSPGTVFVDIGTSSTDVIIADQGGVWLRTLSLGGNHFTDALVDQFNLSFPKAEVHKREAGSSKYARQIFQAMRPVFSDLVQNLQRTIGFYQSQNRDADLQRIICVGSTFKLPGLRKFLQKQLEMEIIKPMEYERASLEGRQESEFAGVAINMATAYGLALQGLGLGYINANILPKAVIKSRIWKAKGPIFLAAASLMLVVGVFGFFFQKKGLSQDQAYVAKAIKVVDKDTNQASKYHGLYEAYGIGTGETGKIDIYRSMLGGREVLPLFLADLDTALKHLGTQVAFEEGNLDEILKIPPAQRKSITLLNSTIEYLPGTFEPSGADGGKDAKSAGDFDKSGGKPRFFVSLKFKTPYGLETGDSTSQWFYTHFMDPLKSVIKNNRRPYTIVGSDLPLLKVIPKVFLDLDGKKINPVNGGFVQPGVGILPGGGLLPGGVRRSYRRRTSSGQGAGVRLEELIVSDPLIFHEKTDGNYKLIVFECYIVLKDPRAPETDKNEEPGGAAMSRSRRRVVYE